MANHSPLPWRSSVTEMAVAADGSNVILWGFYTPRDCTEKELADANFALVLQAVNEREALRAACQTALNELTGHSRCCQCGAEERESCEPDCICVVLRNLLAVVEGGQA